MDTLIKRDELSWVFGETVFSRYSAVVDITQYFNSNREFIGQLDNRAEKMSSFVEREIKYIESLKPKTYWKYLAAYIYSTSSGSNGFGSAIFKFEKIDSAAIKTMEEELFSKNEDWETCGIVSFQRLDEQC